MALISSPTTLNLHSLYPSMFNNICLAKKTIPTSCLTINARCSSSISVNNTSTLQISKEKRNNNIVFSCSSSSPWLMLPSTEAKNNEETNISQVHTLYDRCFYDISCKTFVPRKPNTSYQKLSYDDVKCVGASHGWLAFMDRSDCSLYLCNPVTTQTIELPPIETLLAFDSACYRKLDDASFKIAGFWISKNCNCDGHGPGEELETCEEVVDYLVGKIILTSSPLEKDCVVVLSAKTKLTTLAFCKIGDKKWTNLDEEEEGEGNDLVDVVFRSKENKIYAMPDSEKRGQLQVWDLSDASSSPEKTMLEYEIMHKRSIMCREYLVESSSSSGGKLLMVLRHREWDVSEQGEPLSSSDKMSRRYPYKTLRFDVFEFDEGENKFEQVKDLDGMALFVGINHSVAVNAREVPGIEPNAIYFGDDDVDHLMLCYDLPGYQFCGHDFGIYNIEDDSFISPCYSTQSKRFLPPPVWIVPR